METVLNSIYYDPKNIGSFSGPQKLYRKIKKSLPEIKLKDMETWLKKQLAYTLHKPALRKHKRNKIIVHGIDDQWEADLIDMKEFQTQNQNVNYILSVIDTFSKFAWVEPLENKNKSSVSSGLKNIFKKGRTPNKLRTDKGKKFLNNEFKKVCENYNVQQFTSNDDVIKCAVAEKFNRTLKNKIFAYFTANSTRSYLSVLQDFVTSYNSTLHRTIKMAPVNVTEENEKIVFKNL